MSAPDIRPWIALVRHGRPAHDNPRSLSPAELGPWIAAYNRAEVGTDRLPPSLLPLARRAAVVLSSNVSRCVQSRRHLVGERECRSAEVFAEPHLPHPDWRFPRLPVTAWRILLRALWFCGYARHSEPIARADARAREAAEQLIALAETHGSVLLVGHGIMNILIARHLRARGWAGPRLWVLRAYWHLACYRRTAQRR